MKNLIVLSILFVASNLSYAQCSFNGIPKAFFKYSISDDRPTPDKATKPKVVMEKLDFSAKISAVKSGDQFYYYFHFVRSASKRFTVNQSDPLELTTFSGKKVSLEPSGDFKGKKSLGSYVIGVFYKVSKEQLEILANDKVESLKLNVTSEKEITGGINIDGGDWESDPNGDIYYTTKIKKKSNQEKLATLSKCLLTL